MPYGQIALIVLSIGLWTATEGRSGPDVAGKVVLANLDRYDACLRVGKTRREIKPKKASILSPKKYPVTIEFWSGNTKVGWRKETVTKAGIYGFNFKRGSWTLTELKKTQAQPRAVRPGQRAAGQPRVAQTKRTIIRQSAAKPSSGW